MNRIARRSHLRDDAVTPGLRSREGFAMFMALGALVIIGVLVAASSFITMQETRLGQNSLVETRAFSAAEYGLNKIQADWDKTPNLAMANGASFDTNYALGKDTVQVRYTRLNNETFWITSEGRAFIGPFASGTRTSVKRIGAILRLRIPTIKAKGAITTAGNIAVKGSGLVNGDNTTPSGWTGCATGDTLNKPALVVKPGVTPDIQKESNVVTTPPTPEWVQDSLAGNDNTYVQYGDETWNTLVSQANVIIPPGSSPDAAPTLLAGECNKSDPKNWGEPWRPPLGGIVTQCQNYFPIIYAQADLALNNGRGQGILLVEGDARFNGQFEWYGLIIVKDDIVKGNGSANIYGGIMARNASVGDPNEILGNITVKYSQCSIEHAMRGSASVVQAKDRSWTELY